MKYLREMNEHSISQVFLRLILYCTDKRKAIIIGRENYMR